MTKTAGWNSIAEPVKRVGSAVVGPGKKLVKMVGKKKLKKSLIGLFSGGQQETQS